MKYIYYKIIYAVYLCYNFIKNYFINKIDNKIISITYLTENGENKLIYNIYNIFLFKNIYQLTPNEGYLLIKIWESKYMTNNLYYINCKSLESIFIKKYSDILYLTEVKHIQDRLKILAIQFDDIDVSNIFDKLLNRIYRIYMSGSGLIILYNYLTNQKINNKSFKSKITITDYDMMEKIYYSDNLIY